MKRFTILFFILVFFTFYAKGQVKTYLVPEIGPTWDISRVQDPGKVFKKSLLYGTTAGIGLWQEVYKNVSIGSGIYFHKYSSGLNPIDQRHLQARTDSYSAILIPARFAYRIQHPELPISISLKLGYQLGFILNEPIENDLSSFITNNEGVTIAYNSAEANTGSDRIQLIEAGISIEYKLQNNWQLSLNTAHFSGIEEIKTGDLSYQTSAGNTPTTTSYSNDGSKIHTTLGLEIPLSNLWEKRDIRLHRKIENAYGSNASLRKIRYLYFGGDIGALWRLFSTTNPAIGARPLSDRGIFRYSNLHTGAYIGYNFNGSIGIDIGAYYQRSSTFYSVMYDHYDVFTGKAYAPLYIDIPIMFKYFYDLRDMNLSIVPSIGISVLTHLSANVEAAPGGSFEYSNLTTSTTATVSSDVSRTPRFGYAVRAGLGFEYDIPIKFPLTATCNVSYSQGLRDIDLISITTSIEENPSKVSYNGSGWMASLGIRIPILLGKDNRKCGAMPRIR